MSHADAVRHQRPWGTVTVDAQRAIVLKEYRFPTLENSRFQAAQEMDRLTRFGAVLARIPGLRSPRPLSFIEGTASRPPSIEMEWCAGESLHDYLLRDDITAASRLRLADRFAQGLIAYVETFEEHYADASFHNALYDPDTDMLTVFDFGPWRPAGSRFRILPLESSLGSVFGSSLRTLLLASPRRSLRRRWQLLRTAATVIVRANAHLEPDPLNSGLIRRRALRDYTAYGFSGGIAGRAWHATGGLAAAMVLSGLQKRLAIRD